MVLSKFSSPLWDPIRRCHVQNSPEERVRQKWLAAMTGPLGYPKGLLSVESGVDRSNRRFDILCYTLGHEGLVPLLLIECKAEDEKGSAVRQVFGYNETIQAPFVCVIQGDEAQTFWKEGERVASVPFLPTYAQLKAKL